MAVLVVIGRNDLKGAALTIIASRNLDRSDLTALGGGDGSNIQLSELHLGFHTEEVLGALDKGIVERQTHVSDLEFLEDVLLVARIFDLHVVLKVKGVVVIEVRGNGELFTHLAHYAHIDLLIEFKTAVALLPNGN